MELENKIEKPIALITGAAGGIGYEIAKQFAQNSFDLILVSNNPAVIETAQVCEKMGAKVDYLIIDIYKQINMKKLFDLVKFNRKKIDTIAINIEGAHEAFELDSYLFFIESISSILLNQKSGRLLISIHESIKLENKFRDNLSNFEEKMNNEGIIVVLLTPGSSNFAQQLNPALLAEQGFEAMMVDDNYPNTLSFLNTVEIISNKRNIVSLKN